MKEEKYIRDYIVHICVIFVGVVVVGCSLFAYDSLVIKPKKVAAFCGGELADLSPNSLKITTEKFLLDTTKEEPVTTVPADPSYKKLEEYKEVDASCPTSTAYNGERYELTYVDPTTNQTTTVIVAKEFVIFEKVDEGEPQEVVSITATVPYLTHYGDLVKRNKNNDDEVEIIEYIIKL